MVSRDLATSCAYFKSGDPFNPIEKVCNLDPHTLLIILLLYLLVIDAIKLESRPPDKSTPKVCCNCLVPAAAMIAYRMFLTPERLCRNPQMIEVENYTAALFKEDACILISTKSNDTEKLFSDIFRL